MLLDSSWSWISSSSVSSPLSLSFSHPPLLSLSALFLPGPSISTNHHTGTDPKHAIPHSVHQGSTTYPALTPTVNRAPPKVGPTALPTALTLVATPFSVPSSLRLPAEFVNKIVEQGNAKITHQHFTSMSAIIAPCRVALVGSRVVKGVKK